MYVARSNRSLALLYLARGADENHVDRLRGFVESYRGKPAGIEHTLFVIFKGFAGDAQLSAARQIFDGIEYHPLYVGDDAFDMGAYAAAASQISSEWVCCLNTNSSVAGDGWLGKLAANLDQPRVGIVGATGSFESLSPLDPRFPEFPNVHVRSNAFMMGRALLLSILSEFRFDDKLATYLAESGPGSITRRVFQLGLSALVVGRNGRGYSLPWWPSSQTFRQGNQGNLLVHDNATRAFERMPRSEKRECSRRTWGSYYFGESAVLLPA